MTGATGAGATGTTAMTVTAAADAIGAQVTATAEAVTDVAAGMTATTVRCAMFPAIAGDPAPAAPAP